MITVRHNVTEFTATVPLTPFCGQPEDVTIHYAFFTAKAAREMMDKKSVPEVCAELVRGWEGVDVPFSQAAMDEMLDYNPAMGLELISGFWRGLSQARAKN